ARRILAERSQASTNQQLYEMTAGLPSLFPACSLQGMVQLTRVSRIARLRLCKATRAQTCRVGPPSHSSRSSIDLARRVVVERVWVRLSRGQRTAPAGRKALLHAVAVGSSIHTRGVLQGVCATAAISSESF